MKTLKPSETITLSEEDYTSFVEALEKPVEVSEKLLEAGKRYEEEVEVNVKES